MQYILLMLLFLILCKKGFNGKRKFLFFCVVFLICLSFGMIIALLVNDYNFELIDLIVSKMSLFGLSMLILRVFNKYFKIEKVEIEQGLNKKIIFSVVYYILCIFIFTLIINFLRYYSQVPIEQLVFHLQVPVTGTAESIIYDFLKMPIIVSIIACIWFVLMIYFIKKYGFYKIGLVRDSRLSTCFRLKLWKINLVVSFFIFGSIMFLTKKIDLKDFILNQFIESSFISEHYVSTEDTQIAFPDEKRNLIYIYLESMEASYKNGAVDYTPNLTAIAKKNTDLSINGGAFYQITGATWTIASMVAQTSGLPLKFSIESESYNVERGTFLNGVSTLGDILAENGYKNYFYLGSDAAFASRDLYFSIHGDYEIFDYKVAKSGGYIPQDYSVFWGFEDRKLYEFSKEKLLEIAENDEPFNFTLLTVDTHATDGYLDSDCNSIFKSQLENVLYCSDSMVGDFISWIQEQDFYANTTVIVVGDHLYMANDPILSDERFVYATIINSSSDKKISKVREFCAVDMFPTTLEALGIEIEGDKLGLGVSLYSNYNTLIEEFGYQYVNDELKKKSTFYSDLSLYE